VIPGQPYHAYQVVDSLGRTVQFYLSEAESRRQLPLVVFVQGSGASSLFRDAGNGRVAGTMGHSTVQDVFAEVARVLLVEKPGVTYLDSPRSVEEAPTAFHREHTLERWAVALRAAIGNACSREGIACEAGLLVIGHSEGGVAAARVAATESAVTHTALLAGEGPTQLYSLLRLARTGDFFARHGASAADREAYLLRQWQSILQDPDATDRFFFGHPYRRWSSFLATSPASELQRSRSRVFIAQGTADRAVTPESADVLFSTLAARGRDVCYSRVEGADHSFALPSANGWEDVLGQVKAWFLGIAPASPVWTCSAGRP
jgi:pimeloyl-ACP methyl ester carboxylesterase